MKVLVTGVRGQLGYDVCKRLDELGMENRGVDRQDFDLTDEAQVRAAVEAYAPDCVIHCAAYTAVDKAEVDREACMRVNEAGTRFLAQACERCGASMVYISTDYVFPGTGDHPYEVNDPKGPQNVYGESKLAGERAVEACLEKRYIVRVSWVFGLNGGNFVKTMLRLGKEKESLTVVNDQVGAPTYTRDLAVLLCDLIQTQKYGVYHAPNEGCCSWSDFAAAIMREAGLPMKIVPVLTRDYTASVAKRPLNSRLSTRSLTESGLAKLPPWEDALRRYLRELDEAR